ncbi:MAG: ATP-dependent zinc metalloprotease FtsH [bacterium]|nr:ATP-dependent zinc metalloprotease FtsH [bacterium]
MGRCLGQTLLYGFVILLFILLITNLNQQSAGISRISYSKFSSLVDEGKVEDVTLGQDEITGRLSDGTLFSSYRVEDASLYQRLQKAGVTVYGRKSSAGISIWLSIFSLLLPVLVIVGMWAIFSRQTQTDGNQTMSFGKSKATMLTDNRPKVTFSDVAGVDEAEEELQEVVEFLRDHRRFEILGATIPKGVLLLGPPGSGKTLLARAVAGEAGVPFFFISGSNLVEMFVGVGASRVRDLFSQAKKNAPCIIFIDEIDAVGRQRGAGLGGGHDEREQTLNQLLVEMDGFEAHSQVIVLAATNRPDILDPALLRPGRFDRRVTVDNPDVNGREAILKVHVRGKPLDENVNLAVLARRTPGFSGADIANMVNEAAILAARENRHNVSMAQFEASIDRVVAGPERKSRIISDREKEVVAYHETGHAMVAWRLPDTDPVHKISILPRGLALGYTMQLPMEDRYLMSKTELTHRIAVMLGGRVAEKIIFNEITTGAQNDIQQATEIARRMITEYGMSDLLGPLTLGHKQEQVFLGRDLMEERNYGDEVASIIDHEVHNLIDSCYKIAEEIITRHRWSMDRIAKALIERETIEGDELNRLFEKM